MGVGCLGLYHTGGRLSIGGGRRGTIKKVPPRKAKGLFGRNYAKVMPVT